MLQNGEILGGMYQVIGEIGKGGSGIIYLGYHLRLQKQIVIKKIKDINVGQINTRIEADILKKLHHRYLPQVYDFLEMQDGIYTIIDYIPGHDLSYYLGRNYNFPEETILKWMHQMCEVLEYLHSQKPPILHSDIKPGNIMVTENDDICLIDFNVSLDGEVSKELQGLSRSYAAPEQFQYALDRMYGKHSKIVLDARMDIYSMGAVFYRLMTGWTPDAESGMPYSIMEMNLPYNNGIKAIVNRATAWEPSHRFQSAKQMRKALDNVERMDPQYKALTNQQILTTFGSGLLMLFGIFLILFGTMSNKKEKWQEAYDSFYEITESGTDSEVVTEGIDLLNNGSVQGVLKKYPEKKAEILHAIGDSYFRQKQYEDAIDYYKEALDTGEVQENYLRDYMMALARSGQNVEQSVIEIEYPEAAYMERADVELIEAQTKYTQGEFEEALIKCEDALAQSTDIEVSSLICVLESEIYTEQEEYTKAADSAIRVTKFDSSKDARRRAGSLAFEAGNHLEDTKEKNGWYEKARKYYETLCQDEMCSYEDEMNYALVLQALEQYSDSNVCLRKMREEYPDDYKVLMWMCYNYLGIGNQKGSMAEVESDLNFAYSSCKYLYSQDESMTGGSDEDMEKLNELMKQLEE